MSRCITCFGVMVCSPDEDAACMLCARTGHEAEAQQRALACSRDGCLRDAVPGKNFCQWHQRLVSDLRSGSRVGAAGG